jgi:hypothetical protein
MSWVCKCINPNIQSKPRLKSPLHMTIYSSHRNPKTHSYSLGKNTTCGCVTPNINLWWWRPSPKQLVLAPPSHAWSPEKTSLLYTRHFRSVQHFLRRKPFRPKPSGRSPFPLLLFIPALFFLILFLASRFLFVSYFFYLPLPILFLHSVPSYVSMSRPVQLNVQSQNGATDANSPRFLNTLCRR